jgi:cell wall-associated NlpC family hydrolase
VKVKATWVASARATRVAAPSLRGYVDHVGLYAGDGQFLHAPHTGAVVGYNALSEPYYSQRFVGGRRVTG